jgi:hypothetical protein
MEKAQNLKRTDGDLAVTQGRSWWVGLADGRPRSLVWGRRRGCQLNSGRAKPSQDFHQRYKVLRARGRNGKWVASDYGIEGRAKRGDVSA